MQNLSLSTIKQIRSLHLKKNRNQSGLFIAEGEKLVAEALESDFRVKEVYRTSEIGEEIMARISTLSSPSPALAVVEQKNVLSEEIFADIKKRKAGLYIALDGVKDPGNFGTIMRIAEWFGVDALFAGEDCVEVYNPKCVQSTMGAIFRLPVAYTNIKEIVIKFNALQYPVYGTFLDGKTLTSTMVEKIREQISSRAALIVMGNESAGISKEVEGVIKNKIFIPSYTATGRARNSESLNVAIATAVILSLLRI